MMKYLNVFFAIVCVSFLASCGASPEQQKLTEDVKATAEEWGKMGDNLTELVKNVDETKSSWEKMYEGMNGEGDEAVAGQLDSLKTACKGHGDTYDGLATKAQDLKAKWDDANQKLDELTQKMQGGSVDAAAGAETLANVKTAMEALTAGVEEINSAITETKSACTATCEAYANLTSPKEEEAKTE